MITKHMLMLMFMLIGMLIRISMLMFMPIGVMMVPMMMMMMMIEDEDEDEDDDDDDDDDFHHAFVPHPWDLEASCPPQPRCGSQCMMPQWEGQHPSPTKVMTTMTIALTVTVRERTSE